MKNKGATLLELVVTLATVAVALGLVATLVMQYQAFLRRDRAQTALEAQAAQLQVLRNDLSQATRVVTASPLVIERVDPALPRPVDLSLAGAYVRVSYYQSARRLMRKVEKGGTLVADEALFESVSAFTSSRAPDGLLIVNLGILEGDLFRNLRCEVLPWVP